MTNVSVDDSVHDFDVARTEVHKIGSFVVPSKNHQLAMTDLSVNFHVLRLVSYNVGTDTLPVTYFFP
jgi:hypothetical protein